VQDISGTNRSWRRFLAETDQGHRCSTSYFRSFASSGVTRSPGVISFEPLQPLPDGRSIRLLGRKIIIPWVDDTRLMTGPGETGLAGNLSAG
jgi:hypothetical protein